MATPFRALFRAIAPSFLLAGCALGIPLVAFGDQGTPPGVHTWVDEYGTIHISRHPPPPGQVGLPRRERVARAAPAPSADPVPEPAAPEPIQPAPVPMGPPRELAAVAPPPQPAAPQNAAPEPAALARIAPPEGPLRQFDRGLLFRVEDGDVPLGYVFGTMHVNDPRVLALPDPIEMAFRGSDHFCMESLVNEESQLKLVQSLIDPGGQKLSTLLGEEFYSQVSDALTKRGIAIQFHDQLKPWAALLLLVGPEPQGTRPHLDLDLYLAAVRSRKTVCGLETVTEAIAPLEALPTTMQIKGLREIVQNRGEAYYEATLQEYLAGDTGALVARASQVPAGLEPDEVAAHHQFLADFIDGRNARMVQRLLPQLKKGQRTFVAVGALHLPGENGVLAALEKRGYRVSRVY